MYPNGAEISYSIIPQISSFTEPLRSAVRAAFADSIRNIWYTGIGLSALGLVFACLSKALVLSLVTDEEWDVMQHRNADKQRGDVELGAVGAPHIERDSSPRLGDVPEIEEVLEHQGGPGKEQPDRSASASIAAVPSVIRRSDILRPKGVSL